MQFKVYPVEDSKATMLKKNPNTGQQKMHQNNILETMMASRQ